MDSLFDVQVKRIHEYKRQLLNILYVVTRYNRIKARPDEHWVPRTVIFRRQGGARLCDGEGHHPADQQCSTHVNQDPRRSRQAQVRVFLPDYDVSLAQTIMPAADLSQQISTAGMEASGTGNMKLALNGALTIGTLDGANIEIRDQVGAENIFIFGMTGDEAAARQANGYRRAISCAANPELAKTLEMIRLGVLHAGEHRGRQGRRRSPARDGEPFLVLADFAAYCEAQDGRRCACTGSPRNGAGSAVLNYGGHGPVFQRPQRARIRRADLEHQAGDIIDVPLRDGQSDAFRLSPWPR